MSNCRTFNRSRKDQQPKPQNPGIIRINQLAHDIIVNDPEKFVNHLVVLFVDEKNVAAGGMLIKLASGAILEVREEEQNRRPGLVDRWTADLKRQDETQKQKEAQAAQEAATRELGQIPEPETTVEAIAAPAPQPEMTGAHSNASNTHVNEIGLPVSSQSQTMNAPGTRSCRSAPRPSAPGHPLNQAELNQSGASIYA